MTTQPASSPPGASPPGGDWHEPSDAELAGCWPDPFAGPPEDGDAWLDGVTAADLDALLGPGRDERQEAAEREYADAEFWAGGKDERLPPGPVLATLSQDVLDAGLTRLSDDELVGVLRASRRLSAWQNGVELAAVAQLDARRMRAAARPGSSRASEHVSAELAAALVLTGRSADLLLGLARDLSRLPAILAALLAGRIDRARAAIFASELAGLGDQSAKAVAMAFAGAAGSMTTGQLRAALRAMVLYIDPRAAQRRAERGRADARVEAWQENSGNGALAGRELPPADAAAAVSGSPRSPVLCRTRERPGPWTSCGRPCSPPCWPAGTSRRSAPLARRALLVGTILPMTGRTPRAGAPTPTPTPRQMPPTRVPAPAGPPRLAPVPPPVLAPARGRAGSRR